MRPFSAPLLAHFRAPHRAGALASPDGTGGAENPPCGDLLEVDVRCADGRLIDLRFRALGCVPLMASGSAMTDLALGLTLPEARALTAGDLAAALGGLPEGSAHAAGLAIAALRAALRDAEARPAAALA